MKRQAADDWDDTDDFDEDDYSGIEELAFDDDDGDIPAGDEGLRSEAELALSQPADSHEESVAGGSLTDDDLAPEILLDEDGARSPAEGGDSAPADRALREVPASEIGAGDGLDEAELGRLDPLDGKPWQE